MTLQDVRDAAKELDKLDELPTFRQVGEVPQPIRNYLRVYYAWCKEAK